MIRFVQDKRSEKHQKGLRSVLVFVVTFLLFVCGIHFVNLETVAEEKQYLEQAIERAVIQCYAIEGRYPQNLAYIEDNYGLMYDKERFFVDYRTIGSNLRPEIVVLERKDGK